MIRSEHSVKCLPEHKRKTGDKEGKCCNHKRNNIFHRHADHIFRLHETDFIAYEPRLHEKHKAAADQYPHIIYLAHIITAFRNSSR